jgi:hypothetical protein
MAQVLPGIYAMRVGDLNGNGTIQLNIDGLLLVGGNSGIGTDVPQATDQP